MEGGGAAADSRELRGGGNLALFSFVPSKSFRCLSVTPKKDLYLYRYCSKILAPIPTKLSSAELFTTMDLIRDCILTAGNITLQSQRTDLVPTAH